MQLGQNNSREDIMRGEGNLQIFTVLTPPDGDGNRYVIQLDATNNQILIQKQDSSGAYISSGADQDGQIIISGDDIPSIAIAKFRAVSVCVVDGDTRTTKTMYVLGTEPV